MKKTSITVLATTISIFALSAICPAATCTYNGTSYACEADCLNNNDCSQGLFTHSACDSAPSGNGDGKCVLCGDGGANEIYGTSGADIICGKGGNDLIYAAGGADVILADAGNDVVYGEAGDDYIDGGNGNDQPLDGGDGDDLISGGAGHDWLWGGGGNDVLNGGAGDDTVLGQGAVLGDVLCGGDGDDTLVAEDAGYHCLDGGKNQTGYGGGAYIDCGYDADSQCSNSATYRNCVNPLAFGNAAWNSSQRSCNCP